MLLGPLWRAIVLWSHGGVVLSTEHSQGGDTFSRPTLRDGEQRQRLKCGRVACGELTTKGGKQKRGERRQMYKTENEEKDKNLKEKGDSMCL